MPVVKITEGLASRATEPAAYWDTELKGFGLIVRPTGRKSLVVQKSGRRRWTLGHHPVMKIAEARRRARDVIINRPGPAAAKMTLEDALKSHTRRMERRGCRSADMLDHEVRRHLGGWLRRPLAEITRAECRARHERLSRRGEQQADRVMRHLRAIWNTALKQADLPTNPTIAVEWHGGKRRDYPRIDLADWHARIAEIENPVRRAWYLVALSTGLRCADCSKMRWDDVDLDAMSVHRPDPKGGRPFDLPISTQTAKVLRALPQGSEWVFPSNRGSRGHLSTPQHKGLPNPHHLRAEYMAIATDLGVPTYPKKLLVNHAVPRADVTDGYVARPDVEMCRPWQQRVSDRVFASYKRA